MGSGPTEHGKNVDEESLHKVSLLPVLERKMRIHKLRENVRRNNISVWVDSFLKAAFSRNLDDFPSQETVQFHEKDEHVS